MQDLTPEFTLSANAVHLKMKQILATNEDILALAGQLNGLASTSKEREITKNVEQQQVQVTNTTIQIKNIFTEIEEQIKKQVIENPDEPETRAIIFKRNALLDEFKDVLIKHQEVIQLFKQTVRSKMVRQIQILDPTFKEDDYDDPLALQKLMTEKMLGKASLQVEYRVDDIKDKYADILKLERSVQLTFQLLNEISILVDSQGRDFETIELHINQAKTYAQKGEKRLLTEKKEHIKSRKKLCCIILIGLAVVGVILTPVILKLVNAQKH